MKKLFVNKDTSMDMKKVKRVLRNQMDIMNEHIVTLKLMIRIMKISFDVMIIYYKYLQIFRQRYKQLNST